MDNLSRDQLKELFVKEVMELADLVLAGERGDEINARRAKIKKIKALLVENEGE